MKKVVGQSYASNYQIDASPRSIILLLNKEVEARDIPGFICTSGGNCRSKGRFFTAADVIVHMKIARLNRKMRRQPSAEQHENRKHQDLPAATPELHQDAETPSERNKVE